MRWRLNTLRAGKALCRLYGAFSGVVRLFGGGQLPYLPAGMPASGSCARIHEGRMAFARGEQLLFGPGIKMFALEHLYSVNGKLLFVDGMLFLVHEIFYSARRQLLSGHEQLFLCAVHRLLGRGIFYF